MSALDPRTCSFDETRLRNGVSASSKIGPAAFAPNQPATRGALSYAPKPQALRSLAWNESDFWSKSHASIVLDPSTPAMM